MTTLPDNPGLAPRTPIPPGPEGPGFPAIPVTGDGTAVLITVDVENLDRSFYA